MAIEMITNMAPYGFNVPMWFCPSRAYSDVHRDNFRTLRGRELITPADLVDEYVNIQRAAFAFPDLFWWVPRRLGASGVEFPVPTRLKTRIPDPWPSRIDDATISTQPIISDWIVGEWDEDRHGMRITGGGHAWPTRFGPVKSGNSGFADGHVETRPRGKLQWQVEGQRSLTYVY